MHDILKKNWILTQKNKKHGEVNNCCSLSQKMTSNLNETFWCIKSKNIILFIDLYKDNILFYYNKVQEPHF
jgi:hypothetical protein